MLGEFSALFRGSSLAHGTFDKLTGNMVTILAPATEEDYRRHLVGDLGLGIVPVDSEGKCYFGAIDVDIDTIDHQDLYKRVSALNLPLTVCRSKSGGAHLYVFFKEPQPSSNVRTLLKGWALALGFPASVEIFPKQTRSIPENVGSWLNLPYFSAHNTVRYAVYNEGSVELEEFLTRISYYNGNEKINVLPVINAEMPPCLQELTHEGLPQGTRNVGLFNYGVFYRKSSPSGWEDKLREHNKNYVMPPLGTREVEALIKSLGARQYQYKCDEEPICSHCDRKKCLQLPFGVGHKPWEDESNFDEITTTNLRKILSDPPSYILEVNSEDIRLSSEEFRMFEKFRKRLFELRDLVVRPIKQGQWELKIKTLLASKLDIEAPDDASLYGRILGAIDIFLSRFDARKGREDLLRGLPILEGDKVLFKVDELLVFLASKKIPLENQNLFALLQEKGCKHDIIRVKGKVIRAWSIPLSQINRQTEDFTDVTFEKEEPEI